MWFLHLVSCCFILLVICLCSFAVCFSSFVIILNSSNCVAVSHLCVCVCVPYKFMLSLAASWFTRIALIKICLYLYFMYNLQVMTVKSFAGRRVCVLLGGGICKMWNHHHHLHHMSCFIYLISNEILNTIKIITALPFQALFLPTQ